MNQKEKIEIIKRYKKRLTKFGLNVKALATGNSKRRNIRYKIITDIGIKDGDKILDFGCGLALYSDFLKKRKINIKYTGVDISHDLIDAIKKKNNKINCQVRDIEKRPFKKKEFDYVVCSQVFNHKYKFLNNSTMVKKYIKLLLSFSKKGLAIDFLSNYVDFKEKHLFYHNPEKIFTFSKKLSNKVNLRHDYNLFEFCLYIFPKFKGWKKNVK